MTFWTEAVIVAVVGLVSVIVGNIVAGWFQLRKVRSSSDLDESQVAEKYQAIAAEQAAENKRQADEFKRQLAEQVARFTAQLAAQSSEIAALRAAFTGPFELRVVLVTQPTPDVLEATLTLLPRQDHLSGGPEE